MKSLIGFIGYLVDSIEETNFDCVHRLTSFQMEVSGLNGNAPMYIGITMPIVHMRLISIDVSSYSLSEHSHLS
jgi:hypothetical protein